MIATPVALGAGLWAVTDGGVESGAEAVVNDHDMLDIVLPPRSWAPLSVAVYVVAEVRLELGVKVTVWLAGL